MKTILTKILVLSVSFSLWNCNKSLSSLAPLPFLLNILQEESEDKTEKEEKEEKEEKKPVISDSDHTLSNDISLLPKVDLENEKSINVSLNHKIGDKYVSSRIILENVNAKDSFDITTSKDIGIEMYRGVSPLKTKVDKKSRFEKVRGNNFKLSKNNEVYSIQALKKGDYTLLLVSSSEMKVEIQRIGINDDTSLLSKIPTQSIEITEAVQTIPTIIQKRYEKGYLETTIQLTYNLKRGDRIMVDGKSINKVTHILSSPYNGTSLFKDKADMQQRETGCLNLNYTAYSCAVMVDYGNSSPGYIVFKTGAYSNILYLFNSKIINKNYLTTVKMVKIPPKVPRSNAPITAISDISQDIEYTLDKRNELYSGWTSNQFTLNAAKKGTKIIVLTSIKSPSLYQMPELSMYRGTERLTKEDINTRYFYEGEVVSKDTTDTFKIKYSIDEPGDYSIVFTTYDKTKQSHKVKRED